MPTTETKQEKTKCETLKGCPRHVGAVPRGLIAPLNTKEVTLFTTIFLQFGKQHWRWNAIFSSIVSSQQCYEVYFIPHTAAKSS